MNETKIHFQGRYIGIAERDQWEFASRTNAHAVAVIIPVTEENELILVEQFRIPVNSAVIELPAGLVGDGDDPTEEILVGANRELIEETGYQAECMTEFLSCPTVAGLSDEIITFLMATGLKQVGPGGGDESEDITVHKVHLSEVNEWLATRQAEGLMLDPKIFAALYWLDNPSHLKVIQSPGNHQT